MLKKLLKPHQKHTINTVWVKPTINGRVINGSETSIRSDNKNIWQELLKDCVVWEYEQPFIDLLEKISKPRTKITKKDATFFISQIEDLLSRNYLIAFKYESVHKFFS